MILGGEPIASGPIGAGPSGSGTYTLTMTPAAFVVGGGADSLDYGPYLDLDPGSFVLSGSGDQIDEGGYLNLSPGSFALTVSAQVMYQRSVAVGPGSFGLSAGQGEAYQLGYQLARQPGGFNLTYRPYPIQLDINRGAVLTPGTLVLTGDGATLIRGRPVSLGGGTYVLTGDDVSIEAGAQVTLGSASFAVRGMPITYRYDHVVDLVSGAFVVSEGGVTSRSTHVARMTGGTFNFDGAAATIARGRAVTSVAATFELAGGTARAYATHVVTLSKGALSFVRQPIALALYRDFRLSPGLFTLMPVASHVPGGGSEMVLKAGSLVLTGQPLPCRRARVLDADTGPFNLWTPDLSLVYVQPEEQRPYRQRTWMLPGPRPYRERRPMREPRNGVVLRPGAFELNTSQGLLARTLIGQPGMFVLTGEAA